MTTYPNAKINIGLDVVARRPDGYHDLESLFVPYYGLRDCLSIEPSRKFGVEISGDVKVDWDPVTDLTAKAYKLLSKDFSLDPVSIKLEKHIPVGAGLGGGSADGAFALRMLSEIFDLYLPDEMLEVYAAELGSDCPFFVYDSPMFVSGRGDVLEPFSLPFNLAGGDSDTYEIRVTVPENVSISTKEAYSGITPFVPEVPLRELLSLDVSAWKGRVKNDFEAGIFAAHPELVAIKEKFYEEGAVYASMSGSGSAIFGIFRKTQNSQSSPHNAL